MPINYGPTQPYGPMTPEGYGEKPEGMTSPNDMYGAIMHPGAINPGAPNPTPETSSTASANPMGDLLQHYTQAAQRFSSPYLMLPGNSWLAQQHPGAANVIDNALSAVALTQQGAPASAGMNISAAMRGALEANQMKRQQQLQVAMLPYHMMMPQLQAQD